MQTPLSIDEALGLAPGSAVLELPGHIETAVHVDVWESLYRWLQARLPEVDPDCLPGAVLVGQEALRELLIAEQERLKDIGLSGEELDEALTVSSDKAGLNLLMGERPLEGRWLLVRPV